MLAGVSSDYYTRLEKGNLSGVSDGVLHAIADALKLDEAERMHLFDLARFATNSRAPKGTPATMIRPSVQLMLDGMTGLPAFVTNGRMDVLAHNQMAAVMYSPVFATTAGPPNFARFNFLDPAARQFYARWSDAADTTVSMLRTETGRNPHDKALYNLIGELCARSDEFSSRWAAHNVRLHRTGVKNFNHPEVGNLTLTFEVLDINADEGLTMTVYSAEPGSPTADALKFLASLAATDRVSTAAAEAGPGDVTRLKPA